MFIKKSILLTNKTNTTSPIAILKLDNTSTNHTYCTIKAYNIPNDDYILGIQVDGHILKQNVFLTSSDTYNFKIQNADIDSNVDISAVLSHSKSIEQAIVWSASTIDKAKIISYLKDSIQTPLKATVVENAKTTTIEDSISEDSIPQLFEEDDIESVVDDAMQCDDNTIKTDSIPSTTPIDMVNSVEINENTPTFYEQIKDQLDDLFSRYPREETLSKLIPNSEWVKVTYENNDSHYVVGVIYENDKVRYICFGVPGSMDKEPTDDLKDYSQWLPTDIVNPKDHGYWVMYQDSENGENIVL